MSPRERPSVCDAITGLIAADRQAWSLLTGHRNLDEVAERLRRVTRLPKLPDVRHLDVPADRVPLVAAHGPGVRAALAEIATNRNRLWVIAPFRSAIRLIESEVVPDVIVLAERDAWPVESSLDQWRALPADQSRRLSSATLVVDAFAPEEIVARFTHACTFDSGPGRGTALPLHGFGVLAAVSLALVLGHRHIGLAGVDRSPLTRLGGLLATLAEAEGVRCCDVASCGLAACVERGPVLVATEESLPTSPWPSHLACAGVIASGELHTLAGLLGEVQEGLACQPADVRLASLVQSIRSRWRLNATVVAAVERADLKWVSTMWELDALAIQPVDAARSAHMTAGLVLEELADALDQHLRDCRACLEHNLAAAAEVVA